MKLFNKFDNCKSIGAQKTLAVVFGTLLVFSFTCFGLSGCSVNTEVKHESASATNADLVPPSKTQNSSINDNVDGIVKEVPEVEAKNNNAPIVSDVTNGNNFSSSTFIESGNTNDYIAHEWKSNEAPNAYKVNGAAIVNYTPHPGEYIYTGIDNLGRTTAAYALITKADYNRELAEKREEFGKDVDTISGWGHNTKVKLCFPSGKEYNGYFYNRSHLIADSLGGKPTKDNLVTGSRFQNVGDNNGGGMGYIETKARDWLSRTGNDATLYYCVTPVYIGNELVPRSVYVDAKSSDGSINEHVEVFNVSGDSSYSIDYMTGAVLKDGIKIK